MSSAALILLGKGAEKRYLLPGFGNRHGLITGATGTGKTVTLQILAGRAEKAANEAAAAGRWSGALWAS